MSKCLSERVRERYIPLLERFRAELLAKHPAEAYRGLSEIFLPAWGKAYERAPLKMAFVGLETYGWGCDLSVTIEKIGAKDWNHVFDVSEFQNLDYTQWGLTRYTFWGFSLFFLAALYGVKDWNILKQRAHADILDHFVWGNAHAIESDKSKAVSKAVDSNKLDWATWADAFEASRPFNTFAHLQELFAPQVTIMMCAQDVCNAFLSACSPKLQWKRNKVRLFKVGDAYVFNMPHPNRMKYEYGADAYAKTVREALQELGLFQPLPEFVNACENEAQEILGYLMACVKGKKTTREAVRAIAEELHRQGARMTVGRLCDVLNATGFRTRYDTEYTGGRGSYRMISCAYTWYDEHGEPDVAEKIAQAFTKHDGSYAYLC